MTHDEVVGMKEFNEWWDSDIIRSSPFRRGSPAYWAWAGWEAALREHAMSEVQRIGQEIQPEQEPVGQLLENAFGRGQVMWFNKPKDESMLYTTPPQRTWVGLTDEEKNKMAFIAGSDKHWLISLVENKLKKQNETT